MNRSKVAEPSRLCLWSLDISDKSRSDSGMVASAHGLGLFFIWRRGATLDRVATVLSTNHGRTGSDV